MHGLGTRAEGRITTSREMTDTPAAHKGALWPGGPEVDRSAREGEGKGFYCGSPRRCAGREGALIEMTGISRKPKHHKGRRGSVQGLVSEAAYVTAALW